jgi:hypothetical protein
LNNYQVDENQWSKLSLFEQMGNIASEVGRTQNAIKKNDHGMALQALGRGLDLIDATAKSLSKSSVARCRELLRAREIFSSSYDSFTPDDQIEKYFMQFAVACRLQTTELF